MRAVMFFGVVLLAAVVATHLLARHYTKLPLAFPSRGRAIANASLTVNIAITAILFLTLVGNNPLLATFVVTIACLIGIAVVQLAWFVAYEIIRSMRYPTSSNQIT